MTAEFAVTLPAVVLLFALLLAGSAAGVTQLRIEEAARAGARALARGDADAVVENIVRNLAGEGSTTSIATEGEWLRVTVATRVSGPLGSIIPWTLTASASARSESPEAGVSPLPDGRRQTGDSAGALADPVLSLVLHPSSSRIGWGPLKDAA